MPGRTLMAGQDQAAARLGNRQTPRGLLTSLEEPSTRRDLPRRDTVTERHRSVGHGPPIENA
jgi:hypothetical protein